MNSRNRAGLLVLLLLTASAVLPILSANETPESAAAATAVAPAAAPSGDAAPAGMVAPQYDADGKLLVPTDYRTWIFVGASIGLSYNPVTQNKPESAGFFHHTYIQPEAYKHYRDTGKFPEKTMLILELYSSEKGVAPDVSGFAQGKRFAVEVAIKDHSHFEEGWAYFNFAPLKDDKPQASARANPKMACFKCHAAHAEDDNVFTQYYPVLREARAAHEAEAPKAP